MGACDSRGVNAPHPAPDLAFVLDCVRDDAAAGRLAEWGSSSVIDEHTNTASFGRALFDALHAAAGLHAEFPVGHAGLIHVYGYWFSEVATPFGFKRARWQDGELARALGRSDDAFHLRRGSPLRDPESTPLQRVTEAALPPLRHPIAGSPVGEALIGERLSRVVLVERAGADGPAALVYGIAAASVTHVDEPLRLITAFPYDGDRQELIAEFEAYPAPRWNAVADS